MDSSLFILYCFIDCSVYNFHNNRIYNKNHHRIFFIHSHRYLTLLFNLQPLKRKRKGVHFSFMLHNTINENSQRKRCAAMPSYFKYVQRLRKCGYDNSNCNQFSLPGMTSTHLFYLKISLYTIKRFPRNVLYSRRLLYVDQLKPFIVCHDGIKKVTITPEMV